MVADRLLLSSSDDIRECLFIFQQAKQASTMPLAISQLRAAITGIQQLLNNTPSELRDYPWLLLFSLCGAWAIHTLNGRFDELKFCELLMAKQAKYGPRPIREWGSVGVIIRISSKLERYINLKENSTIELGDESLVDTLHDIVGYAVLGYRHARETSN